MVYAPWEWKLWAHRDQPEPIQAEKTASGRKKKLQLRNELRKACVYAPTNIIDIQSHYKHTGLGEMFSYVNNGYNWAERLQKHLPVFNPL